MALNKRVVGITIDNKGQFTLEAKEGFSGESCLEKTRNLEVVLGGEAVAEGKTDAYYDGDGDNPISINLG
jgi:hypothetical protein